MRVLSTFESGGAQRLTADFPLPDLAWIFVVLPAACKVDAWFFKADAWLFREARMQDHRSKIELDKSEPAMRDSPVPPLLTG